MKIIAKVIIILSLFAVSLFGWTESGLSPSESPTQSGINDSFLTAGDLGNYSPPSSAGTGFIANDTDNDYYKINIPAAENYTNHDILKVSLCAPENTGYRLIIYESDGGTGFNQRNEISSYDGETRTAYVDISNRSGTDWLYAIQVRTDWNSSNIEPYYLTIEIVDSGYIQGQINLIGVGTSGLAYVNIEARNGMNNYISSGSTDTGGNYSIKVPKGVEITNLIGVRWWYPGCDPDWAYGRTTKKFTTPLVINNQGQIINNINFEIYKEGVISGSVSAPNNVDIIIMDNYSGDWIGNCSNVNSNYEIHNLEAGNYWMFAKQTGTYNCNEAAQPISYTPNVNVRDGYTTTVNYNIGAGANVNGSLNPSPSSDVRVYVKPAGLPKSDGTRRFEPFSEYYKVDVSGNTFEMRNLPSGMLLDWRVEAQGPSLWNPVLNTPPIPTINFTGPALNSFISGEVIDNTGDYPDLSVVGVYAIISGTTDVMSDILGYMGICNSSGNFMINVPSGYYYDLVAVDLPKSQSGPTYFIGRTYDVSSGSMFPVNIYINNGYYISGNFSYLGQPISFSGVDSAGCYILKDMGLGNFKFYDMAFGRDSYITGDKIENGNYKIVGQDTFFNKVEKIVTVNGSPLTEQNLDFTIDKNRDYFKPWAGQFIPENNGYIYADDYLYVTVSDKLLGSGLQFVVIQSDGQPVVDVSGASSENNTFRYQFRLPSAQRIPGSSHTISINLTDYNGNQYQVTNWVVNIHSSTATPTSTPTGTWWTATPTNTGTATPTPTATQTYPINVFGTITLPAASNGKDFGVAIDTDTDGGNGWVSAYFGTTDGTDKIQYSLGAPDGNYYIYALVDESGDGIMNGPNAGDYFGFYGGTGPFNPPPFPNANVSGPNNVFNFQIYLVTAPTPTPTPSGTPVADWYESALNPPEQPWESGVNDSEMSAATISNYLNKTGIGYIANGGDQDYYKFTVLDAHNNPNHDMLKITLSVPQGNYYYNIEVYERNMLGDWNYRGSKGADGGEDAIIYLDISNHLNEDWEYMIRVNSYNNSSQTQPYSIKIEIVDTGYIAGTLNLIGVGLSGLANVNVEARTHEGIYINSSSTNSTGNYQIKVPVSVPVTELRAVRWWYQGCASDWAYGKTTKKLEPALIVNSAGEIISGNDFDVYKEGVITGTIYAANNVDIIVLDPYKKSDWIGNCSNVNFSYAIHNLEPGNYCLFVKQTGTERWYEADQEAKFITNINVVDGFTITNDIIIGNGYTVSGNLNPSPLYPVEIRLQLPGGNKFRDICPLADYYWVDVSGNTYEIRHVPEGSYDFIAGDGPSMWSPVKNVFVNSNRVINFSAPDVDTTISGMIVDNTGMFSDFSSVIIAAVVSGTTNLADDNAYVYMGSCSAGGSFSVGVPSQYQYYDLVALYGLQGGGAPIFLGRVYDVVTGTASPVININSGYSISGTQYYMGKTLDELFTGASVWVLKDMGGGVYKFYDFASGESSYITGNFIENGNYLLKSSGYFFNEGERSVIVSGSNLTGENILLTINPAKDKYKPYIGYLNPAFGGVVVNPSEDYLYVTISDKLLGTGIAGEPDILVNSISAVDIDFFETNLNERRYKFRLPPSERTPGMTCQISVSVQDNQNNSFYTGMPWIVYVATATITPTPTISNTPTDTPTGIWFTDTPTNTGTNTPTYTNTPTRTPSYTPTLTPSKTPSNTPTETWTNTETQTHTFTETDTATNTPTETYTDTPTETWTNTETQTHTFTETDTDTNTPTETITDTITNTPTETMTNTQVNTNTATETETQVDTLTYTPTNISTNTPTDTFTNTPIHTMTDTPVNTNTPTSTPTGTWFTDTPTNTFTETSTNTITNTPTHTQTFTTTYTPSNTPTDTMSFTPSNTFTITQTPTITETPTITPTSVPVDKLVLNKNLINLSKDEVIIIRIPEKYKGKEGKISIYTRNGKLVKTIEKVSIDDDIAWDGKNETGKKVASGVYILRVKIGDLKEILKIAVVK